MNRITIEALRRRLQMLALMAVLACGSALADLDPDLDTVDNEWDYPGAGGDIFMRLSNDTTYVVTLTGFNIADIPEPGDVVTFFVDGGFYHKWTAHFGRDRIRQLFDTLSADRTVVVMGAGWDQGGISSRAGGPVIDLSGKTNIDEMLGLLRGAAGGVGFPAGNTIVGAAFGTTTVMLYDDHFDRRF